MTVRRGRLARVLGILGFAALACLPFTRAEPVAGSGNEAANRLWQSFIAKYNEFSLQPLDAKLLDEKARAVLIRTSGPKFSAWETTSQPSLPEMAAAMALKDPAVSSFDRIERTLIVLLPQIDPYAHYRSASDVAQLGEAMRQNPGSVHMTLDQAADGRILCFPLAEGPAELAGVNPGAQLLAVDGRPAEGKTISAIRLAFVGPPDSPVALRIKQPQGKIEDLTITRTAKSSPNIAVIKSALGLTVRIRKFDTGSARTVKEQLEPYPKPGRLTLDLRGNGGGLRDEALKIASLFFPEGTPLGKFTTKTGPQTANDGNGVFLEPTSINILQDERTASAAEYLIATLKEGLADKVTLFGKKTYGKSHSTAQVMLEGGGELAVTETLLSTASGKSWDKTGIPPDKAEAN